MYELLRVDELWFEVTYVEVHQSEEEDGLEVVVPFSSLCLVGDGARGVEDGAFHEEGLVGELNFNYEGLPVARGAEHVEGGLSFLLGESELFAFSDVDVGDVEREDGVEGPDDEILVSRVLENSFEGKIDHWVDVADLLLLSHGVQCLSSSLKFQALKFLRRWGD